jgi:hypothetical protein
MSDFGIGPASLIKDVDWCKNILAMPGIDFDLWAKWNGAEASIDGQGRTVTTESYMPTLTVKTSPFSIAYEAHPNHYRKLNVLSVTSEVIGLVDYQLQPRGGIEKKYKRSKVYYLITPAGVIAYLLCLPGPKGDTLRSMLSPKGNLTSDERWELLGISAEPPVVRTTPKKEKPTQAKAALVETAPLKPHSNPIIAGLMAERQRIVELEAGLNHQVGLLEDRLTLLKSQVAHAAEKKEALDNQITEALIMLGELT